MTAEEAWALDEYRTVHTPKVSGNGKSGFFAKHKEKGGAFVFVGDLSAVWLRVKAAGGPPQRSSAIRCAGKSRPPAGVPVTAREGKRRR